MNRRTVAAALGPLPLAGWWASRLPLAGLLVLLVLLLLVAATAGVGLGFATSRPSPPPTVSVAAGQGDTPVEVLPTVPGVNIADLIARVEDLERRASWVADGVDDIEIYVNLPDPPGDVVAFLEQLDQDDDHAAG